MKVISKQFKIWTNYIDKSFIKELLFEIHLMFDETDVKEFKMIGDPPLKVSKILRWNFWTNERG